MKSFTQVLKDCFVHITSVYDKEKRIDLRDQGAIDSDGYFTKSFGEHNEYELSIEPGKEEGEFFIALYKNKVSLMNKLPVWTKIPESN